MMLILFYAAAVENLPNICQPGQVSGFTCPGYSTFFNRYVESLCRAACEEIIIHKLTVRDSDALPNSAVQWGTIGAGRLYSAGQIYNAVFYGFVFGAILPVPVYMLTRRYPNSFWKFVSVPVFLYGMLVLFISSLLGASTLGGEFEADCALIDGMFLGPLNFAPYNLSYLTPGLYIALGSMYFVRKHYLPWWTK